MQLISEIWSSASTLKWAAVRASVVRPLSSSVVRLNRKRKIDFVGPAFVLIALVWSASAQTTTYSAITESEGSTSNRSTRARETRVEENGRTIETQIVEEPSVNGGYVLKTATEKETIHDASNMVRVVERWYVPDGDGQRRLSRISESETTVSAANQTTIRTTYESDLDGHLREVAHNTEESTPLNASANQTVSTLFVPREGVFAPVRQGVTFDPVEQTVTVEIRKENGIVDVQRTISVPNSTGKLIPTLVTNSEKEKAAADSPGRYKEEVLGADAGRVLGEGEQMSLIQRTVTQEWKDQNRQEHSLANRYSMFPLGVAPDGELHLTRQVATVRQVLADGETQVVQEIAETPGANTDRLQPRRKIIEISSGSGGQFETRTIIEEPNSSGAMQPSETSKTRGFRSGNH